MLLVTNAPKSARATRHADPMANPFPIAAVVFPAESRASVLLRDHSFALDISQIPPALSLIGPNPSIVRAIVKVLNIPSAARLIPNIFAKENEVRIEITIHKIGIRVDLYPRARPRIIFGAAPLMLAFARFLTGEYYLEVKNSANQPIQRPDHNPTAVQINAYNGLALPPSFTFLNSKVLGKVHAAQ